MPCSARVLGRYDAFSAESELDEDIREASKEFKSYGHSIEQNLLRYLH